MIDSNDPSKLTIPKQVGEWNWMDGILIFGLPKKPNIWYRFWVRIFFNGKWTDYETEKT